MTQFNNLVKSIDVIISIDGKPLGGQQGAVLERKAQIIDITNKINGDWSESLSGIKTWNITCQGLYVIDDEALQTLEDCFMENKVVKVSFAIGSNTYNGSALLVDFPTSAIFNKEFKYNLKLLGTGPLEKERYNDF